MSVDCQGDQRTRSHPPKPRRFLRLASRHSTLIYIACPAKKRGGLKERLPIPLPSYLERKRCMSVNCKGIREHAPTLQNRAGFFRLASRHSTLIYIACLRKKRGGLKGTASHTSTFIPRRKRCMSVDCQGIRKHAPTLRNRAGFSIWPAAIAL